MTLAEQVDSALQADAPADTPRIDRRWAPRLRLRLVLPPLLAVVGLVAIWYGVTASGLVGPLILPTPDSVVSSVGSEWPAIAHNLWVTVEATIEGFVIGNLAAIVLAIVFVHCRPIERALFPIAMVAQVIPIVVVIPVLDLWLGHEQAPSVTIAALFAFFPTLVYMDQGLRSADAEAGELLYTLSATWWQRLWLIRFPASLPFLFEALHLAVFDCVAGVLIAEWVGSNRGLGYLMSYTASNYLVPELWVVVIAVVIMSLFGAQVNRSVERRVMRWPGAVEQEIQR
jgi:ABC-type nitrate/sulfonate/bicarbonate transport system permease component